MWLILTASAVLFLSFRSYLYWRYRISVPALVLGLAFGAVGIDTAGNHFYWYQGHGWAIPYDRIAHATVPALLFPAIAWLLREWLAQIRVTLPLSVLVFFSANLNFAMAAFYEITEVWDDLYFGGDRIKDILDTPRDLQFDLLASVIGALVTYAVMKPLELKRDPRASASHAFASPAQIR